jgi:hypothetical protein
MSFKINPAKATVEYCAKTGQCNLQEINDVCYGVCGAYSRDVGNVYNISEDLASSCADLLEVRKKEIYGEGGSCNHQGPLRPVLWNQCPRFVPMLLRKGLEPQQALQVGKQMCQEIRGLENECMDNCDLDYSAIEDYKPATKPAVKQRKVRFSEGKLEENPGEKPAEKKSSMIPMLVFMGIFVLAIILCYLKYAK